MELGARVSGSRLSFFLCHVRRERPALPASETDTPEPGVWRHQFLLAEGGWAASDTGGVSEEEDRGVVFPVVI